MLQQPRSLAKKAPNTVISFIRSFLIAAMILVCTSIAYSQIINVNVPFAQTGNLPEAVECAAPCEGFGQPLTGVIIRYSLAVQARFICTNNDAEDALITFGLSDVEGSFNCFVGIRIAFADGYEVFNQRVDFRPVSMVFPPLGTFDSGDVQFGWHNSITSNDPVILERFATAHLLQLFEQRYGASCVTGPGNVSSGMLSSAGLAAQFMPIF